jgi:type II secretory pathway component PulF
MTWLLLFLVGLWIAVPMLLWLSPVARWIWPVLYHVPLVGPLWRWSHLSQFASLMALLTEQKVPLVDALQITASGLTDSNLAQACRRVAAETELGRAFVDCLAARRQFPASLIPMVRWGQNASAMSEAFRAAAEWLEGRGRSQGVFLETMLVPVLFVAVMVTVGFFVIALFLPLTSLISMLSGGSGHLFL